jgi:hypothetical protein
MPEGSSSAAPVITPGPRMEKKRLIGFFLFAIAFESIAVVDGAEFIPLHHCSSAGIHFQCAKGFPSLKWNKFRAPHD